MRKLFFIIAAIAWVGLSSYPAYAAVGSIVEKNTEAVEEQQETDKAPDKVKETQETDKAPETTPDLSKTDNNGGDNSPGMDNTSGQIKSKKSKLSLIKKAMAGKAGVIVLIALVLIVSVLLLWLVYRKLSYLISRTEYQLFDVEGKLKNNIEIVDSLHERVVSCERKIKDVEGELDRYKAYLVKLKQEQQSQPKIEKEVVPQVFPAKTWYGKYDSSREGFFVDRIKEQRENNSQFVILQTAETLAEFSLIEDLPNDLFSGAVEACNVLSGDTMNFSKISVENKGRLILDGKTWKVVQPVQITLH